MRVSDARAARRRQGNAGRSAWRRSSASSTSPPATCCAPRWPSDTPLGREVEAYMQRGRARARRARHRGDPPGARRAATATCSTASRARSRRPTGVDFDAVVYLDVPDEVVKRRLLARGRADDTARGDRRAAAPVRAGHARRWWSTTATRACCCASTATAPRTRSPPSCARSSELRHGGERRAARRPSRAAQRSASTMCSTSGFSSPERTAARICRAGARPRTRQHDDVRAGARRAPSSGSARRRSRTPPCPAAPGSRRTAKRTFGS